MSKRYTVRLNWRDKNRPPMIQQEKTETAAQATACSWFARFAGIKSMWIEDSEERLRHVANARGEYQFSVPY